MQSLSLVRFREHYSVMSYRLGWMGYQECQVCKEPIDDQLQTDTEYHFGFAYHFLCWRAHTNWGDRSLVPAEYKETSSPRSPLHASGPCIRLWFPTQTKCVYSRLLSLPPPGSGSYATRVAVYRLLLLTGISTDTNTTATAATTTPTTDGTSATYSTSKSHRF